MVSCLPGSQSASATELFMAAMTSASKQHVFRPDYCPHPSCSMSLSADVFLCKNQI